jgi:BirA family biotin operon repressor/biotin-[acetyl-CoA-carboxylase] ligase
MDTSPFQKALASFSLPEVRFFDSIGSTNDEALAWATEGAADLSLVIADEQIAGRGRAGRKWATPPGAALAFSLILRPAPIEAESPSLFTGLGALALVDALKKYELAAQIKWPNDVLLNRKKCAGILVESVWTGEALDAVVLGMGVNVLAASVPPANEVLFPATSVEAELGRPVDRAELLRAIIESLLKWRPTIASGELVKAWEEALAFKQERVQVWDGSGSPLEGRIVGLESDGGLRLLAAKRDKIVTVHFGEMHLRPSL